MHYNLFARIKIHPFDRQDRCLAAKGTNSFTVRQIDSLYLLSNLLEMYIAYTFLLCLLSRRKPLEQL